MLWLCIQLQTTWLICSCMLNTMLALWPTAQAPGPNVGGRGSYGGQAGQGRSSSGGRYGHRGGVAPRGRGRGFNAGRGDGWLAAAAAARPPPFAPTGHTPQSKKTRSVEIEVSHRAYLALAGIAVLHGWA